MSVSAATMAASSVNLRGLDVLVDVHVDVAELERREAQGLSHDLGVQDAAALGALLQIPAHLSVPMRTLSAPVRTAVRRHTRLVERLPGGRVRRRVSPGATVEMVTLPTSRWRTGLRSIGRFAPYSSRRLLLSIEPVDVDLLVMEATFWGVGVSLESSAGSHDLVLPAPFEPARYTGASWVFAEQAMRATRQSGLSSWPLASA